MNREIKFRAWDGYNKSMLNEPRVVIDGMVQFFRDWQDEEDGINLYDHKDSVVMQYTGLKDKDNVEIYEGDILFRKHSIKTKSKGVQNYDSTHIVEWKTHDAFNYDDSNWVGFELPEYLEEHEVIGNIYENPELVDNCA